jgi:pSer/pThr/pTyr-binding forkhead associated (FHA) protein
MPPAPAPVPAAPPPPAPQAPAPPVPPFSPGVLSLASGAILPIPQGKPVVLIGREDPVSGIFPEIDLDPHGGQDAGVGRRHAQLLVQGGQVMIEDLNSVNGTAVNRQKIAPHQPHPLKAGDEIRLGKLAMIYQAS